MLQLMLPCNHVNIQSRSDSSVITTGHGLYVLQAWGKVTLLEGYGLTIISRSSVWSASVH